MSGVTIEQLAKQVGNVPSDKLISQLQRAGIEVSKSTDVVTDEQKEKLLSLLRQEHGEKAEPLKRISLKRKSVSEIKVRNASGQNSTVSVVLKKRKVYVKKELTEEAEADETIETSSQEIFDKVTDEEKQQKDAAATASEVKEQANDKATDAKPAKQTTVEGKIVEPIVEVGAVKDKQAKDDSAAARKKGKEKGKIVSTEKKAKGKKRIKEIIFDDGAFVRGRKKTRKTKFHSIVEEINPHAFARPTAPVVHEVKVPEILTVGELAQKMSVKTADVLKTMMTMGVMATINQSIDQDTACLVVEEMGHKAVPFQDASVEQSLEFEYQAEEQIRPPIVTVMGHVDHGKTSLLDYIRRSRISSSEAGGITQHIGSYKVHTSRGDITFIDTPGHESFTAMRARGANCTDIVILIVAADDGVMPQTIEAIQHAKAAGVPIIVAVNKIDKPEADLDRVTNELSQYDLIPESWGGDSMFVHISAKTGQGIDELLDSIMLQAEVLELRAPYEGPAQGAVIEARLDKGRGPVATVLIKKGTLRRGDMVLAGIEYGRIKLMHDDNGKAIDTAGPSVPVEVLGLSGVPVAGEVVQAVEDEAKAKEIATYRHHKQRELRLSRQYASKLDGFMNRMQQQAGSEAKSLNIVLKADVQGSLEALMESLEKLSNEEVKVKIIAKAVGGFNESDVNLALASDAFLVGFNVRANATARKLAQQECVPLNYYSIIYDVIDGVKSVMQGKLAPKLTEKIIGTAEVREVFRSTKWGAIAGCMVVDGAIKRGCPIRVLRNDVVIYEGELESLRRFQENTNEARKGMECGIGVKNYNDIKNNDQIEVYEVVEEVRSVV